MSIISQIYCPRCNNKKLYKFGKDPKGNQKYQCKNCKRQFTLNSLSLRKPKNYPRCPKCGRATFVHHVHKYYKRYKCVSKKCRHAFSVISHTSIPPSSSTVVKGKSDFSRMRFPLHVILLALNLFYLCNVPTRKISTFLLMNHNIKVSHVSVARWLKVFAPVFKNLSQKMVSTINLAASDEWHCDETVVKINGKKYYIWFLVDSETRFIIDFHLSPYRDSQQALTLLFKAKQQFGSPRTIVSDRLKAYEFAVKTVFSGVNHIRVDSFNADISNNLIESFHGQFKAWYKTKRGFNSFDSANSLISMFVFFFNFIRPHSALNNWTPAQVAGIKSTDIMRNSWFLIA